LAKPKKVEAKKENWKDGRIKANAVKRAARHAARVEKQSACPKRGLARAMSRWCYGVSRDFPVVLTRNDYTMSKLVRMPKRKPKDKPSIGLLSINGKVMGSMAEALFHVREMQQKVRERTLAGTSAS
jgi:hypothetical protein